MAVGHMPLSIFKLLRVKQWSKNLLTFAAWLFSGRYTDSGELRVTLLSFLAMCLASSGTYVFNDIADRERDSRHPKKKNRPIASGAVPVGLAAVIGTLCVCGSLALAMVLNATCFWLVLSYLLIQVAYNLKLKHVSLLDVFIVASGFIIRAVLGASALVVPISGWFLVCTGALALMLGFAKRRNEFVSSGPDAGKVRETLTHYTRPSLDALVIFFAGCSAVFYGTYTLESSTGKAHPALILTVPCVIYGISRYMLLVFNRDEGGEPADLLFGDLHILGSLLLFLIFAYLTMTGTVKLPFLIP